MNVKSILWIFFKFYSSVFPLHGNILCIFFVFVGIFLWHVNFQKRAVPLVVFDNQRAWGCGLMPGWHQCDVVKVEVSWPNLSVAVQHVEFQVVGHLICFRGCWEGGVC
jgi:hypothetical protein